MAINAVSIAAVLAEAPVQVWRAPSGATQPQAVIDELGTVHLIYAVMRGNDQEVRYVRRGPKDKEWSQATSLNAGNGIRGRGAATRHASIALGRNGRLHVVWFDDANIWYTRTGDSALFETARPLAIQNRTGIDAYPSVAADLLGSVYIVWHAGNSKREDRRNVFILRSIDEGLNFGRESVANPTTTGVCACCGLAALAEPNGGLYISYRSAGNSVHRDMTLLNQAHGGQTFSAKTLATWEFRGCPVSTTAFAHGPLVTHVTWETKGQVFFANVREPRRAIAAPNTPIVRRKNSVIASNELGETLLAWVEGNGWISGGTLHWLAFDLHGKTLGPVASASAPVPERSLVTALAQPDGRFVIIY